MDSNNEENGRFPKTSRVYASVLIRVKRTLGKKDINISIDPTRRNNYISTEISNQLAIPESNIIEKLELGNKKTI